MFVGRGALALQFNKTLGGPFRNAGEAFSLLTGRGATEQLVPERADRFLCE